MDKAYDIYVARRDAAGEVVVYRSAFFRGLTGLLKTGTYDLQSDFVEIVQSNGEAIFVRRWDIVMFSAPGTALTAERVAPPPPPAHPK